MSHLKKRSITFLDHLCSSWTEVYAACHVCVTIDVVEVLQVTAWLAYLWPPDLCTFVPSGDWVLQLQMVTANPLRTSRTSFLSISQHDIDFAATASSCSLNTMVAYMRILVVASTLLSGKIKRLGSSQQESANASQGQAGNVATVVLCNIIVLCSVRCILMQHQLLATKL